MEANVNMNELAGGNVNIDGTLVQEQSGAAGPAGDANPATEADPKGERDT